MLDDTKQHSLDYGETDRVTSSAEHQHPNRRLNFEGENKRNSKSQILTVPERRGSPFILKSRSISMSIPHLDPSALAQVILSISATMASAANAGAPNSSGSHSSFETNLPPTELFVSTETTDTEVEATSFGTCVFPRKRLYKKAPERRSRWIRKMLVSWICFPCPPGLMQAHSGAQLLT